MSSNQPLSMLSFYHFDSAGHTDVASDTVNLKTCYQIIVSPSIKLVNKALLFHRRFGHPRTQVLLHMLKNIKSISIPTYQIHQLHQTTWEACQMGKVHKLHFPYTDTKTTQILELMHTDLWGPSPILSRDGYQYYISFVNDFSRYTWIYPLKFKSYALEVFKLFKLQVENQFTTTIKTLQSDWGGSIDLLQNF